MELFIITQIFVILPSWIVYDTTKKQKHENMIKFQQT